MLQRYQVIVLDIEIVYHPVTICTILIESHTATIAFTMSSSNLNTLGNRKKFVPAKIIKDENKSLQLKLLDKPVRVQTLQSENDQVFMTKEERKETSGSCAPKRYVTTCYFQPKQNPVSYSETVIVNIGSTKKQYFETVMCQTKLVPFRWTETMTTYTPYLAEKDYEANYEVFVQKPEFHHISLEAQQIAASEKMTTPQEIAV